MKKIYLIAILISIGLSSCRKYLDLKPNNSVGIPQSLTDCQLLMDDYSTMNTNYPADGEAAADNYYITDVNFNSLSSQEAKDNYLWAPQGLHTSGWSNSYKVVYSANQVLQILNNVPNSGAEYNRIKGTALFFRAFSFLHLAQLFAKPYDEASAGSNLGIPIPTNPDLNTKLSRGNLQQTYDRIIQDFKDAIQLLPLTTSIQSRPNKVAAYAALARTYLQMGNYANAGIMANNALSLYSSLMDFKSVTTIARFNPEVIFQAVAPYSIGSSLSPSVAKIDEMLYASYAPNDKRKTLFFRENTGNNAGTYLFKGQYDGSISSPLFTGLATDELYLIQAECYARSGNKELAVTALNTLLKYRYDATFTGMTASSPEDALSKILIERRKELVFRNQRWSDLRRLNKDSRFKTTLNRPKNNIPYNPLVPDDLRYTMLIPIETEINLSGIEQNQR